jgi:hypothetical protein
MSCGAQHIPVLTSSGDIVIIMNFMTFESINVSLKGVITNVYLFLSKA